MLRIKGFGSDKVHSSRRTAASGQLGNSQGPTKENNMMIFEISDNRRLNVHANEVKYSSELLATFSVKSLSVNPRVKEGKAPEMQVRGNRKCVEKFSLSLCQFLVRTPDHPGCTVTGQHSLDVKRMKWMDRWMDAQSASRNTISQILGKIQI